MSLKLSRPPPVKDASVQTAKVVLLGDSTVGKTSLVMRFLHNNFRHNIDTTVGGAFSSKVIELENHTVKLHIWDTSGQERYNSLAPMYFRNANAAIVVYDITSAGSLVKADRWVETLRELGPEGAIIFLAGNKLDLAMSDRVVQKEDARVLAESEGLMFAEVSAKTGQGVNDIFMSLAQAIAMQNNGRSRRQSLAHEDGMAASRSCAC